MDTPLISVTAATCRRNAVDGEVKVDRGCTPDGSCARANRWVRHGPLGDRGRKGVGYLSVSRSWAQSMKVKHSSVPTNWWSTYQRSSRRIIVRNFKKATMEIAMKDHKSRGTHFDEIVVHVIAPVYLERSPGWISCDATEQQGRCPYAKSGDLAGRASRDEYEDQERPFANNRGGIS